MWARIANILLGLWLMIGPAMLDFDPAHNERIVGPVVITFATIAIWGATRSWRRVNIALGIWLIVAPWLLGYSLTMQGIHSMAIGIMVAIFARHHGKVEARFGGGWMSILKENSGLKVIRREEK